MRLQRDYEVLWIDAEGEVQMKSFDDEKSACEFIAKQERAGFEVEINW